MRGKSRSMNGFGLLVAVLLSWCLSAAIAVAEEDTAAMSERGDIAYNRGDIVDAIQWYRKAAELGDAYAQSRLGYIYDKSEENEAAVIWYSKAAEQGYAAGQQGLAEMYMNGEGVMRDMEQGLALMKKAAEQDYLPAILVLARTHEQGAEGVAVDLSLSLGYWRRAAALGEQQAMLRLANAYRNGELGLGIDDAEAAKWQKKLDDAKLSGNNK